jgi:hypothetical protein
MSQAMQNCPLNEQQIVDLYFMEHRAKVLDIAAFLDRIDRASDHQEATPREEDFRVSALKEAVKVLTDGKGDRARRVLDIWSDPTTDPYPSAGIKGASGAYGGPVPPAQ